MPARKTVGGLHATYTPTCSFVFAEFGLWDQSPPAGAHPAEFVVLLACPLGPDPLARGPGSRRLQRRRQFSTSSCARWWCAHRWD